MLSTETIIKQLIKYTCKVKPHNFLPFLYYPKVIQNCPSKWIWFQFYRMVYTMKKQSQGKITCRVEKISLNGIEKYSLEFFDEVHTFSRLNIEVLLKGRKIEIEVWPF